MNLRFNIDYQAAFGEELVLNIILPEGKGGKQTSSYRMTSDGQSRWSCDIRRKPDGQDFIDYYYAVERDGAQVRHEWLVAMHRLELRGHTDANYTVYDHWIDAPEDSYLYSSAFTDCIATHE